MREGDIVCLADSSVNIDIDSTEMGDKYMCINCSAKFRGIGRKIRCPLCDSSQIVKDVD